MKMLLSLYIIFYSLNSWSQSFLVLNKGVVLTTDEAAYVYDFGHFVLPYKVNFFGGVFFLSEDKLSVIDKNGYLYKYEEKVTSKIKGKGHNYFVDDKSNLYTFDDKGFYYKYTKEPDVKKITIYGGQFFVVKPNDKKAESFLYTLNNNGNFFKLNILGLDPSTIKVAGGNFFQTEKGEVFTISDEGHVFSKKERNVGPVKKLGGRFFIAHDDALYTISKEGFLLLPLLPEKLNITDIEKLGKDFFITKDGTLYGVSSDGNIYEREIKHNLLDTNILSL